jgi:phosphoenolpyruvate-protein kinase (PTS system EI component)
LRVGLCVAHDVGKTNHFSLLLKVGLDALVMLVNAVLLMKNILTNTNCGSQESCKRNLCIRTDRVFEYLAFLRHLEKAEMGFSSNRLLNSSSQLLFLNT